MKCECYHQSKFKHEILLAHEVQLRISREVGLGDGCHVLNYNYSILSQMTYDEASEYVKGQAEPDEVSCLKSTTFHHEYFYNEGNSIVSEV